MNTNLLIQLWAEVLVANSDRYAGGHQTFEAFANRNMAHWQAIEDLGIRQPVFSLIDPWVHDRQAAALIASGARP